MRSARAQFAGLSGVQLASLHLRVSSGLRAISGGGGPAECGAMDSVDIKEEPWKRVSRRMEEVLGEYGIDIVTPFSVAWYNSAVPPSLCLSWLGRTQPPLGLVVGNSRALWSPFVKALRSQPILRQQEDPLNTYVKQALGEALSAFHGSLEAAGSQHSPSALVYWAHETSPGKLVAIQRLAHLAGIAQFDEECHLCVHPHFGAWFALRAVVVLDMDPPKEQPQSLDNLLDDDAQARVKAAMKLAMEKPKAAQHDDCGGRSQQHDLGHWRLWLDVRDAIAPTHPLRYSEEQLEYHYTGNRNILDRMIAGF